MAGPDSTVPGPVAHTARVMSAFGGGWSLCGGWAVDAWLGRQTRDHPDIDISVFHDQHQAVFAHFRGWHLIAHDSNVAGDTSEAWDGRPLDLPAHVHATPAARPEDTDALKLEIIVDERSGGDWVLRRRPRVTRRLADCIDRSPWGLPTAVPEVILFYKATAYFGDASMKERPQDDLDFLALLPQLGRGPRQWLVEAIASVHTDHPWLEKLSH